MDSWESTSQAIQRVIFRSHKGLCLRGISSRVVEDTTRGPPLASAWAHSCTPHTCMHTHSHLHTSMHILPTLPHTPICMHTHTPHTPVIAHSQLHTHLHAHTSHTPVCTHPHLNATLPHICMHTSAAPHNCMHALSHPHAPACTPYTHTHTQNPEA